MTSDPHDRPDPRRASLVRAAQTLLAEKKRGRHFDLGFDSFADYAASLGHSPRECREMLDLARVLDVLPDLRPFVESGVVPFEAARALAPVARDSAVLRLPPDATEPLSTAEGASRWLAAARALPLFALQDEVATAVERVRVWPQPVQPLSFELNAQAWADVRRTQALLSEMHERPVSLSEALEIATRHYLDRHDRP